MMRYLLLLLALSASAQSIEEWKARALKLEALLVKSMALTNDASEQTDMVIKLLKALEVDLERAEKDLRACRVEVLKKGGSR